MAQSTRTRDGAEGFTRSPDDPRPPAALVVGIAFTAQLGWLGVAIAAGLPPMASTVGVVVVAVVASWWLVVPASLSMALISFLVVDGFAENRLGQLGWNGNRDAALLLLLLVACAVIAEVRSGEVEQSRRRQSRRP